MPTPATRQELTQEDLRRAWQHCRRDTWPGTYEEAMADPLLSRLVRITAMHPPRAQVQHQPAPSRYARLAPAKPFFDRKRAAAGDRDD
jgi:hypothetical protein